MTGSGRAGSGRALEAQDALARAVALVLVLDLQAPAGGAGPVLPDRLEDPRVVLEGDLLAEVGRGLVEPEEIGRHPDHGRRVVERLQRDRVPPQVGLLPTRVEDESLVGLDEGNPGSRSQEIPVPVFEEIEGIGLALEGGQLVEYPDLARPTHLLTDMGLCRLVDVGERRGRERPGPIEPDVDGFEMTEVPGAALDEEGQAVARRPAVEGERDEEMDVLANTVDLGRLVPFRPGRLLAHLFEPTQDRRPQLFVIGADLF
ncbi:MAG: hypothetical protein MZV63_65280 [Marinilabiliales bacterium]|nr:hypothetical protein [Marinilabiliales bacterium]